eukprot:gene8544-14545_t
MALAETDKTKSHISSCPWGNLPKQNTEPSSFSSLMDEEYAKQMQAEEETSSKNTTEGSFKADLFSEGLLDSNDAGNDLLLAQMLQLEFDKEYDDYVKCQEKVFNKNSNVKISYEKYRSRHPYEDESSESGQDDYDDDDDYPNPSDERTVTKKRPVGPGSDMVTKHDAIVCGRKNAKHVENFPPNFASGDVASKDLDIKLPNHVYNTLKLHSMKEEKHSHKVTEKKEHSTHEQALDSKTRIMLYKLVNSEVLDTINGCISTGKEAVVFHAKGGTYDGEVFPDECAVKVYKTTLIEFKTRDKMYENGISCPKVMLLRKHILVMSFVGQNQKPAPKLKDAKLSIVDLTIAYEQCIEMMQKMFKECNLVHADLSEYNMLWHDDKLWVIDVSQSVEPTHPRALEFLVRDCTNVVNFFTKSGVHGVMSVEKLFNFVSGLEISGEKEDFLNQIRDFENNEELLTHGVTENMTNFDYLFELSKRENSDEQTADHASSEDSS